MIGQTIYSLRVAWPVRTYAGVWDDCYDEPCEYKDMHLWIRL